MGTTKNEPVFIPSDPENHVSDVIVFSNNAYVTRRAKVDIEQGVQKIRIETTAFRIAKDSPQAEVLGHGSILGVQYKEVPVLIPPQPGLESLEAEKKVLEREKSLLMKQMETIDRQKSFLDAFISFSDTQVPKEIQTRFPGPSDVENMVETLGTSYTSLFKKEKALLESLEDMNDKLSLVNRKIGARQQPSPKKRKVIEVIFDSEKDQQIDCRVSYITRNAGWTPVYKTDVPADLSGLNLTMFGIVSQKTGEDWDGVTLSLSNAAPMDSTELPKAATWKVDTPVYPVRSVDAATIGMAAGGAEPVAVEDFELSEDAPVAAAQPAEFRQASEKKLPMAFEYGFDRGIDLPSGEDDAYLPLFTKTIDGTFFVHAVPDTDTSAYLVCRTAPDQALLASRMNIHFDGRFVGATTLTEQQAGTDLLINLGPDRGVAFRKEKTSDKTAETFFGKVDRATVARQLSYVIVIENTKDTDTLVHIEDALPVSGTDRIQIKGLTLSPKPKVEDVDDREGVVRWELLIGAGQTKKIHIEFGIKYPKEMRPFGL